MVDIVLIVIALSLLMTSIVFFVKMIFLKKTLIRNTKKNKILIHDLKGALVTYGLTITIPSALFLRKVIELDRLERREFYRGLLKESIVGSGLTCCSCMKK
ncbi:MAG TPA: hypothetical protein VJN02_09990 [Gammaproteobacteria bacterium]|nr:hypothetical protein [Gammaproteobacteria bacterium]